ncbi:alpha/beta family hydrolase [Myceligenerans pegani]|uniref:Dienelactone hydrolase n=1 Tax=Myceligenerans pegani TaxID=2776917 RepID=A0ABR9N505_9MICO|nr:alpha/beta family hydrolase [Myceligenerans sp. TRM 65318]MBE1878735.1 dienelactone hydrolase [Myceligenerans sp. TRM 65318]MBE3021006.1 dienelactone hydrolase [Myceligenerans sp. TRM 65318]
MNVSGLLLTPGAGASRDHHTLVAVEDALAALDPPLPVRRADFPYRIAGKRMPDRVPVAVAHLVQEAEAFAKEIGTTTDRLLLGGRSYGGRMCSMAVAEGLPAAGLVLLSYPLHPPGRPERLRVDHFGDLDVPALFVSGDKDPFGTPEELAERTAAIPGSVTHVTLLGAHDLRGKDPEVARAVADWTATLR